MIISIEPKPVFSPGAFNIQKSLMVELVIKSLNQEPIYNSLTAGANFQWSMFDVTGSTSQQLNIVEYLKTGTNYASKGIALKPNALSSNHQYRLECNVTLSNPRRIGSSAFTFQSSSAPVGGSIRVSPDAGELLITKFNLTTSGWVATEQITTLEYRFGVVDPSSNNEITYLNSFSTTATTLHTAQFEAM